MSAQPGGKAIETMAKGDSVEMPLSCGLQVVGAAMLAPFRSREKVIEFSDWPKGVASAGHKDQMIVSRNLAPKFISRGQHRTNR